MYPDHYLYTEQHEWLDVAETVVTLGITDFAQGELGEVVFVDLPEVGAVFEIGDEIGTIESVKAVAEVYTPVQGEVIEVNADLEDAPEAVNEEPHGKGWLCKIRLSSTEVLSTLMDASAYRNFLAGS